jgi:hypothetical protein
MCTRISRDRDDQQGPGLRYAIAQWLWTCCSGEVRNVAAILAATTQKKKPRVIQQGFSLWCPSLASTNLSSGYADTKIFCSRLNG